jgi:hypothetical protein
MVRLGENDKPMNRDEALSRDLIRLAGIVCRESNFADWLFIQDLIPEPSEQNAVEWLRAELNIQSRSELKNNAKACGRFIQINDEYQQWKQQNA